MWSAELCCPACSRPLVRPSDASAPIVCPACGHTVPVAQQRTPAPRWFLLRDDVRSGPYDWDAVRQKVVAGAIQRRHLLWQEGTSAWVEAASVPGLFAAPSDAGDSVIVAVSALPQRPRPHDAEEDAHRY